MIGRIKLAFMILFFPMSVLSAGMKKAIDEYGVKPE